MRVLARTWQMLLKGIAEVEAAGRPIDAAEMVLVRIAYAADLPTPDEVIRSLGDARGGNGARPTTARGRSAAAARRPTLESRPARAAARAAAARRRSRARMPAPQRSRSARRATTRRIRARDAFDDLIALAAEKRDLAMKSALERDVRLVRFEDGKLELALEPERAQDPGPASCRRNYRDWTGRRWMVVVSAEPGQPSLRAQARRAQSGAERRRARRSAGAGGADALSRRRNRRRAAAGGRCGSDGQRCPGR